MNRITQLAATFEIESENNPPDLAALCADIEHRLGELEGVEFVSADVGGSTRKFTLVVELQGQADESEINLEMVEAIRKAAPKLAGEPKAGRMWVLSGDDDVS